MTQIGESSCFICHKKTHFYCQVENYTIYRCPECGLGASLGTVKQEESYHRDECYHVSEKQFTNIFGRRIHLIEKYFPQPGKILEIGSSTGVMLSLFQKLGWKVLGIEPSTEAAVQAKKRGISTTADYFEKVNLDDQSFDVVILNHTLEHLPSPRDVLQKVSRILKKGGVVLIDVPNFGSLSSQIYGSRWPYLLPQEHFWHFTDQSLQKLLTSSGFQILETAHPSGIWDYGDPGLELWQSLTTFKKRFFSDLATAVPSLLVTILGKGTNLTVVAQKV